jgi:hypothetical protein
MLTGKAAFDRVEQVLLGHIGGSYSIGTGQARVTYTLHFVKSLVEPELVEYRTDGGLPASRYVQGPALILRYATSGAGKPVDPVADCRVVTGGVEIPAEATDAEVLQLGRVWMERLR